MTHLPHRRELLQAGCSAFLGLGLTSVLGAAQPTKKAKSLIIVYLTGAASHLDTFDLKPDAVPEIRGQFQPIPTSVPGIHIGELLPKMAQQMHRCALVRSLSHREDNHLVASHHVLTGHQQPGAFFDKIASRDDWPCYAAAAGLLRARAEGVPCGVHLPTYLMEGPLLWPGQHAGFLGPKHDPVQLTRDPNAADFRAESMGLPEGIGIDRLEDRRLLLEQVNRQQAQLAQVAECRRLSDQQQLAFSVLTAGKLTQAFEMEREPVAVRDRYGRHAFGQSLLLARRLVEAGIPVVQANMGRVQNWDHHGNIFPTLKRMLPPLDQGVAALLDDLAARGLLDETLVLLMGEFGRTPKINKDSGRDHWASCGFALFAGAGVRGGQVIGKSDKSGAYPLTPPFSPNDLGATLYHVLGIDPASEVRDRQNRPVQLNRGTVLETLFTG